MRTMPFLRLIVGRRYSFVAVAFGLTLLLGCGGDPTPAPADAQANPAPEAPPAPAAPPAAPAAEKPAAYQEAITLVGQAEVSAKSALAELQAVKSGKDLEAKLPTIKKHLDTLPANLGQAAEKVASLDAALQAELERRFTAESALPATSKQIGQELARVMQLGDITSETSLDLMAYTTQWGQRMMEIMAKAQGGGAAPGMTPAMGTQPGTQGGKNDGATNE